MIMLIKFQSRIILILVFKERKRVFLFLLNLILEQSM